MFGRISFQLTFCPFFASSVKGGALFSATNFFPSFFKSMCLQYSKTSKNQIFQTHMLCVCTYVCMYVWNIHGTISNFRNFLRYRVKFFFFYMNRVRIELLLKDWLVLNLRIDERNHFFIKNFEFLHSNFRKF